MFSKLGRLFLIISVVVLIAFTGCETVQDVVIDSTQEESMMDAVPMKIVLLINYPEGGRDTYLGWVRTVAPTLQAFDEVRRIRSYENQDPTMKPNRLVEYEFDSFLEMAAYLNRPEIVAIMDDLPNHASDVHLYTFIQRSDYQVTEKGNYPVKSVYLVNYPLGGKATYLEWIASISDALISPPEVKAITSYDNYYGETPHRFVEFEFVSQEDADTYIAEELQAVNVELETRAHSWELLHFDQLSDFINE